MTYTDDDYLAESLFFAEEGDIAVLEQALREVYSDREFIDAIPTGDHWS